jgi:organic hydroperoxide reductase OsmC/OhrA
MAKTHNYQVQTVWTGNLGDGTAGYRSYSRSHVLKGDGKVSDIPGSSDPAFRGDAGRYNPEELLVGALSSCHMLWVLHLCAMAGIVVTSYQDEAAGCMEESSDGGGQFKTVTLRPRMTITDAGRVNEAIALHEKAHHMCFIARSVNFAVEFNPQVEA